MGKITVTPCGVEGLYIIEPQVFPDARGYFFESWNEQAFADAGLNMKFVQDNQSMSVKGVLRGCHFQKEHPQGKLVRVTEGKVFDVAVDVRPGSETYGQWTGAVLSSEEKNMFYIPEGFAHGFLVLSDHAAFVYKCTDVYDPSSEGGVPWNDPDIAVEWPELDVDYKTSEKDGKHPAFRDQDFTWAKKYL
jgi:dTDP-4-dehydrorhamnose 3,5-epimerase